VSSSILVSTGHIGHSADVKMSLIIDEVSHPVAQLGPDFLILKTPIDHAPTIATVLLSIDGSERKWIVQIPRAVSRESRRIVFSHAALSQVCNFAAVA
jgi:hypothetical protein